MNVVTNNNKSKDSIVRLLPPNKFHLSDTALKLLKVAFKTKGKNKIVIYKDGSDVVIRATSASKLKINGKTIKSAHIKEFAYNFYNKGFYDLINEAINIIPSEDGFDLFLIPTTNDEGKTKIILNPFSRTIEQLHEETQNNEILLVQSTKVDNSEE